MNGFNFGGAFDFGGAAGLGGGSSISMPRAPRRSGSYLPEEEQEDWKRRLARSTGSMIENLGWFLDTPGAAARGVLAGDPLSIFSLDPDRRVSGRELNEAWGVTRKDDNPWLKTAAGLATEIITDPLAWISGPARALTPAGKAASAAGVLNKAPLAAQKQMGISAAAKTMTGRFTDDALGRLLPQDLAKNAGNYAARPLIGQRLAQTKVTLDDVIKAAPDEFEAMKRVQEYLKTKGLDYDAVKDQKLGGAFGIGFFNPFATFTPPGSEKVLDAMDMLGQRIGWSAPVRTASAWFDQRLDGMTGELDQIAALRHWDQTQAAKELGRRMATSNAMYVSEINLSPKAKQLLGADSLFSEQGNAFLTRLHEGKPSPEDLLIKAEIPEMDAALKSWDVIRQFHVDQAKRLGMKVNKYKDEYDVLYSPRIADEVDFEDYVDRIARSPYAATSAEGASRAKYLVTPGGTDDLRFVSTLPEVRAHNKFRGSGSTDEQVGKVIANAINARHGVNAVSDEQGAKIAKFLYRMKEDLPEGYQVFSQHPVTAQARAIVNQSVARSNANFVYDSLAEVAINQNNMQVAGGGFRRLDHAMSDIAQSVGLRSGVNRDLNKQVALNLIERISKRTGLPPSQIRLDQFAIPEAVYNRFRRIGDFYNSPKAQQEVSNLFGKMTNLTKAFLLAWPSRHTRDFYSNAFSVWLETGNAKDTYDGFSAASKILAGNFDEVAPILRQLPQYSDPKYMTDVGLLKRDFMRDTAQHGVLSTLATSDLLTTNVRGDIGQLVPGATPITLGGALKELVPDGSRNPLEMAKDFFAIRNVTNNFETRNPMLNASAKINDLSDSIARLGGYIAMLKQGFSPQEAAKRITNTLVDYSSLTPIERNVFRNIFPWWAYNSRIGKYVVQNMMKNPGGRYAQTIRTMNVAQDADEDHYIPTTLRQQFAIRIPDEWRRHLGMGLGGESNTNTYLTDIDLPGIDTLSTFHPDSLRDTMAELFNQSHPLIKTGAEYVFNTDFYTGRPLSEANTRADRLYRAITGSPFNLPPLAKTVIQNIPGTQRVTNLLGGLADERVGFEHALPRELINATLGVKFRDVDEEWMLDDMARKLRNPLQGYVLQGSYNYVPEERLVNAPPEVISAWNMNREIARRKAQLRKEKAKNTP